MSQSRPIDIRRMTLTALMAALIFVLTVIVRIPTPIGGYIHLGDTGITFAAYALGPTVAMISGGLGTALADLVGYPQFTIASLLVHGVQGLVVGLIIQPGLKVWRIVLSILAGTAIVVGGYFIATALMMGVSTAVLELLPNTIQAVSGGLIGMPLYLAVRRAYPAIQRYAEHSA